MKLNEAYPHTLTDGRVVCHFRAPFDTVLFLSDVVASVMLSPDDKIRLCCRLIFGRRLWSMAKKRRRLDAFFTLMNSGSNENGEQIIDLEQDAPMIRSAFKQQYGIDLDNERGRMSWFEFLERLSNITPDTLYGRVLEIRTTPIPAANQHNTEYRNRLIQQKAKFAIHKKARGADQMDAMWSEIAEMLIAKAGENNG